jgi:hypothetical protein
LVSPVSRIAPAVAQASCVECTIHWRAADGNPPFKIQAALR